MEDFLLTSSRTWYKAPFTKRVKIDIWAYETELCISAEKKIVFIVHLFFTKVTRILIGKRAVCSTNNAGTIGYPYAIR